MEFLHQVHKSDAMLQGLYILQNPANRQERAELFLNFSVVEQVESIRRMDANPSKMAIWLRNSPNRASVEPMLMANFKKVEGNYKTKKDGIRKNWYPRTLKEIAVEVGLNEEYDVFQSWLSGAVHSSPLTLRNGFQWSGESMITTAILFSFRILGEMANAAGIQLTGTERDMMGLAHKSFVDFETPPTPAPEP